MRLSTAKPSSATLPAAPVRVWLIAVDEPVVALALCAYTSCVHSWRRLRPAAAVFLAAAFAVLSGAPLCLSDACPMSATERQACRRMGRECCGNDTGRLSHAQAAPLPPIATTTQAAMVVPPPLAATTLPSPAPVAAAAIVQGIGLFTLFAVFVI